MHLGTFKSTTTIGKISRRHSIIVYKPHHYVIVEATQLLDNMDVARRLKRIKPLELLK